MNPDIQTIVAAEAAKLASLFPEDERRQFDVFLSHSSRDAQQVDAFRDQLEAAAVGNEKLRVYVDRIDDKKLNRGQVTKDTAGVLRKRMHRCHVLVLAVTQNSAQSRWVPWELGFFDGYAGEVYIYPLESGVSAQQTGVEFIDFYEHLSPDTAVATIQAAVQRRRTRLFNRAEEDLTVRKAVRSAELTTHDPRAPEVALGWGGELLTAGLRWQSAWLNALGGGSR